MSFGEDMARNQGNIQRARQARQLADGPQEMTSLREIKQRLAAIEARLDILGPNQAAVCKGLDILLQSHVALENEMKSGTSHLSGQMNGVRDGLVDELKQLTAAVRFFAEAALGKKISPRKRKK